MTICLLLLLTLSHSWWGRRRRRRRRSCSSVNCQVGVWTSWSSCSHQCGTSGTQARTRQQTHAASCGGTCPYHLRETQACNRDGCQNGGTPNSNGCSCRSRVRKGIFGIRDLTKIRCGNRENDKYIDRIRDLTVPREPGLAKNWVRDARFMFVCLSGMAETVTTHRF